MNTIVFIWEIVLLFSFFTLLFMMQDWNKVWFLKKYVEKKQRKKYKLLAEKLLDDLSKGVIRYKEREISQSINYSFFEKIISMPDMEMIFIF